MVLVCDCANDGQDKLYGKGKRVFNQFKNKQGKIAYRCTVCKKEKMLAG